MAYRESAVFTGGSGQMAVIAELLHRECNAAIPRVDIGMDVFAFKDDREDLARIQVKTSRGQRYRKQRGYSARFGVPLKQLSRTDAPPLFYAFAVRLEDGWGHFLVISRSRLQELWNEGCGSENEESGNLALRIRFFPAEFEPEEKKPEAFCGEFNLSEFLDAWESLPPLRSPMDIDV